jgi:hypothetical protein
MLGGVVAVLFATGNTVPFLLSLLGLAFAAGCLQGFRKG